MHESTTRDFMRNISVQYSFLIFFTEGLAKKEKIINYVWSGVTYPEKVAIMLVPCFDIEGFSDLTKIKIH